MRRAAAILWLTACASINRPPHLPYLEPGAELVLAPHPRSYRPNDAHLVSRFELARVRESPNAEVYAEALRRLSPLHAVLADVGWDLVRDVDQALVFAPTIFSRDAVFVVRTREDSAHTRERMESAWASRGHELSCREAAGFSVCAWPSHGEVDRAIIFTSPHEAVIASSWRMPAILEIARDQAARRHDPDEIIEPLLIEPQTALAHVVTRNPPWFARPAPSESNLAVHEVAGHRLAIVLESTFADAEQAERGALAAEEVVRVYTHEPVLSGVARLLAAVNVSHEDDRVTLSAEYGDQDLALITALTTLIGY